MKADRLLTSAPNILRDRFHSLETINDLASLLEVDPQKLILYSYNIEPSRRYTTFPVAKRSTGERTISSPIKGLKLIQRKLAQVLQSVYSYGDDTVHGYVHNRSIVTNARAHARQKYLLNVDIKNFFPSINFGRVRGLFIHRYGIKLNVATVLAQVCCFENKLPQGAPTSPVVSNMICSKMDKELARFARKHGCEYTRYADDLTFSTSEYYFPVQLARKIKKSDSPVQVKLGEELQDIIADNGFEINRAKTRLQEGNERQVVTGLVVNRFPNVRREYVRQIRAMLNAWSKYGLKAAELEFHRRYNKKHRAPYKEQKPSYKNVVRGKIAFLGMVKGKDDDVYIRYWNQLVALAPEFGKQIHKQSTVPIIYTEGKTDPIYLKVALRHLQRRGFFLDLEIELYEDNTSNGLGHDNLWRMCENVAKTPNSSARIFIFDRDIPINVRRKVTDKEGVKSWGNNVYSFLLPIPSYRINDAESVCIEMFYRDDDLRLPDSNGRRLFLNREFNVKTGRHETLDLNCTDRNKYGNQAQLSIVDSQVYDSNNENVALSKSDFANCLLEQSPPFDKVDHSEFVKIFEAINAISRRQ
jgi:RNA-directed DNA polymerase